MVKINFKGIDFAELDNGEVVVLKGGAEFPIENYLMKEEDDGDNIYKVGGCSPFRYSTLLNAFGDVENKKPQTKTQTNTATTQLKLPKTLEEAFEDCAIRTRLVIRNRAGSGKKQIYYGTFNICSIEYHQDANFIYELILKEIVSGVTAEEVRERIIKVKKQKK